MVRIELALSLLWIWSFPSFIVFRVVASSATLMISCKLIVALCFQRNDFHRYRRCRALYDCEADNEDELTFEEGDVIVILAEETEDENWMEGILESDPDRRGLFPSSFVHMLTD